MDAAIVFYAKFWVYTSKFIDQKIHLMHFMKNLNFAKDFLKDLVVEEGWWWRSKWFRMLIFGEKIENFRNFWIFDLGWEMAQNHRKKCFWDVLSISWCNFRYFWWNLRWGWSMVGGGACGENHHFWWKFRKISIFLFGLGNDLKPSNILRCFDAFFRSNHIFLPLFLRRARGASYESRVAREARAMNLAWRAKRDSRARSALLSPNFYHR